MAEIVQSKLTGKRPWIFKTRFHLFLSLFLVLAVPTAFLTVLTAVFVSGQLTEKAVNTNIIVARLGAMQIEEEFFGLRRYLKSFALRPSLIQAISVRDLKEVQQGQLAEMVEQNSKINRAFFTDANGVLLFDYPHDPAVLSRDFSYRDWFKGASQSDKPYVSGFYNRAALGQPLVVTVACKVKDEEGAVLGYLAAQQTIEDLTSWLNVVRVAPKGRLALFDQDGQQALTPQSSLEEDISQHPEVRKLMREPEGSTTIKNLAGFEKVFLSHISVSDLRWSIVAYQSADIVSAPIKSLLRAISIFFLFALVAISLLGWLWLRVIHAYAEDMRRSNQELENFCYSIAHDLRAPLRAMRGYTTIIQEDYSDKLDDYGKDCACRVVCAAERMDRLVNDLLDYGSIAYTSLNFVEIDLDESVRSAMANLNSQIKLKNAEIKVRTPLGVVCGDAKMMERVLFHLLGNALKYVAPNVSPQIEVWSEDHPKHIRVWIKDNGIGIDPAHAQKIFGMFQRLHGTDVYSGTGVGLAIVRKATERMGGQSGVESQIDHGSSFWIELPKE